MVAAMSRSVVAVDPVKANLDLIEQSLEISENSNLVTLVNNPLR